MPAEEQKVCDACHERPATCHSTMFIGDGGQTRDLCSTCWDELASQEGFASRQRLQELILTGKCKYCGQQATAGSIGDDWSGEEHEEHVDLYCEPCRRDYAEFMSRLENKLPDDVPEDDDAAWEEMSAPLSRQQAAAEHYVRLRAAERRP